MKQLRAYIDRLEGETAVLLVEGETLELPRRLLPAGAGEGDWLKAELTVDTAAGVEARQEIDTLRRRLQGEGEGGRGER